jgi:hypothetical protein
MVPDCPNEPAECRIVYGAVALTGIAWQLVFDGSGRVAMPAIRTRIRAPRVARPAYEPGASRSKGGKTTVIEVS